MNLRGSFVCLPRPSTANSKAINKDGWESRTPQHQSLQGLVSNFRLCRALTSLADTDGPDLLTLQQVVLGALRSRPRTWQDCVMWALGHWQLSFHYGITQLLKHLPPNKVGG